MPFEIFLIPGFLFGLFGFYKGLKQNNQLKEASKEKH